MAQRRGHGEGAIYRHTDGKRYVASLDLGRHPETGRRMRRRAIVATRAEASKALKRLVREADEGRDRTSTNTTVGHWCDAFMESVEHSVAMGKRKPRTAALYDVAVRVHIKPVLGDKRLDALTQRDVERWIRSLTEGEDGMAPSTANGTAMVMRMIVTYAQANGGVARNVAARAETPDLDGRKAVALVGADLDRLLKVAQPDARPLWTFISLTGLRIGEARALRWTDLDLDAPVPTLTVARTTGEKAGVTGPPKSKASRRTVPLMPATVALLKAQRIAQTKARLAHPAWRGQEDVQTVFCASDGFALGSTTDAWWARDREAAGLAKNVKPHSMRHGWIRMMLRDGVAPVTVAKWAGHNLATLLKDYADSIPTEDAVDDAADLALMTRAFGARA